MHTPSRLQSIGALALSLVICFAISGIGGAVTAGPVQTWYPALLKPAFTPPPPVFPIAWTLLFLLMAVAAWRVWLVAGWQRARPALTLFAIQLAFNLGWSVLFFGLQRPDLALLEVLALWLLIAATLRAFARIDRWAALALVPYLAWVGFAILLNGGIVWLNRG